LKKTDPTPEPSVTLISDVVGRLLKVNNVVAVPSSANRLAVAVIKEILPTGAADCRVIELTRTEPIRTERFLFPNQQLALLNMHLDLTNPFHQLIDQVINS
jgi:hypothetical protein